MSLKSLVRTEEQEQVILVDWLDLLISQGKPIKYTAIPNSTFTTSWAAKNKNKRMGVRAGLPDMFLIVSNTPIFIELKRQQGGSTSTYQKSWIRALQEANIEAHVCKGFEEAKKVIEKHLKD